MRSDLAELPGILALTDADYDLFRKAVRTLLARTYLIRGYAKDGRLYDFAIRNIGMIEAWCACADLRVTRDEGLGVIACQAGADMRVRLGRDETCALLVLRLLFEEKRSEISLAAFPSVSLLDFLQRYKALTDIDLPKTRLAELLRRLAAFRLVEAPTDLTDPEAALVLYPSLALCLDQTAIEEITQAIKNDGQLRKKADKAAGLTGNEDQTAETAAEADDPENGEPGADLFPEDEA